MGAYQAYCAHLPLGDRVLAPGWPIIPRAPQPLGWLEEPGLEVRTLNFWPQAPY